MPSRFFICVINCLDKWKGVWSNKIFWAEIIIKYFKNNITIFFWSINIQICWKIPFWIKTVSNFFGLKFLTIEFYLDKWIWLSNHILIYKFTGFKNNYFQQTRLHQNRLRHRCRYFLVFRRNWFFLLGRFLLFRFINWFDLIVMFWRFRFVNFISFVILAIFCFWSNCIYMVKWFNLFCWVCFSWWYS